MVSTDNWRGAGGLRRKLGALYLKQQGLKRFAGAKGRIEAFIR